MPTAKAARRVAAQRPASVPSTLTAPSVPRGTGAKVVAKYLDSLVGEAVRTHPVVLQPCSPLSPVATYVVRPKALPISEADVSESLVQKLATKPSRSSARGSLLPSKLASSAHARPAVPEPQTLPGPRRTLRCSAMPSASFCFRRTLVTAEP